MRFSADAKAMRDAASYAARVIGRTHIPILSCLRISAKDNSLSFIGTDMQLVSRATCAGAVQEAGVVAVDAATMIAALSAMGGTVSAALSDDGLSISQGKAAVHIATSSDEFPRVSPKGEMTEIEGGVAAVSACASFADQSCATMFRGGVVFDGGFAFAMNGVRLIRVKCGAAAGQIISSAHGQIIARGGDRLFLSDSHWKVEGEGRATSGPLLDGEYADWKRLLSRLEPNSAVDADSLIPAISMAFMGSARDVLLSCDGAEIRASGERFPVSATRSACACPCDGGEFVALLNAKELGLCLAPHAGRVVNILTAENMLAFTSGDGLLTAIAVIRDNRNSIPARRAA